MSVESNVTIYRCAFLFEITKVTEDNKNYDNGRCLKSIMAHSTEIEIITNFKVSFDQR